MDENAPNSDGLGCLNYSMQGMLEQIPTEARSFIRQVSRETSDDCHRNLIREAVPFNRLWHGTALYRTGGYTIIAYYRLAFTCHVSAGSFSFAFEGAFL
jgi:hypothetical protein